MRRWAFAAATLLTLSACQPDKAQEEAARLEEVVLTSGQPLDCTAALGEAGVLICADSDLRALDRQVAELWTEVSPVTGRPSTLARRHADWLAGRDEGERDWETGQVRPRTRDELLDYHRAYIEVLTEELRLAEAVPDQSPVSALAGGCIGSALRGCQAPAAGYVSASDGRRLAWQIQTGSTDWAGISAGLILFAVDGEVLRPVGWSFEAVNFDAPVLFERDDGIFVAAEGIRAGTGSANADLLFRLDGGGLTELDVENWKEDLAAELPDGFGVWKGVNYNWPQMFARSGVWRDDDGNCCPTGGEAVMDLRVEGTTLRMSGLDFTPARGER
jgi:hypothetical protein